MAEPESKAGKGGGLNLAFGLMAGVAVAGGGLFMSGSLPGFPDSSAADGGADVSAVSRPLANGQNITIVTGSNSPVTLNLGSPASGSEPESESEPGAAPVEVVAEVAAPEIAREKIQDHEGFSGEVYDLYGYEHICFGHQMLPDESREPRSRDECVAILDDDLALAEMAAVEFADGAWSEMSAARQAVVIELGYVLGWSGLFGFENLRLAIQRDDWSAAAVELVRSKLPVQVAPDRLADWQARLLGD